MKKLEVQNTIRITGLSEVSARLGCSKTHLSYVIRGIRESKRLRERAKKLGIRLPSVPKA